MSEAIRQALTAGYALGALDALTSREDVLDVLFGTTTTKRSRR